MMMLPYPVAGWQMPFWILLFAADIWIVRVMLGAIAFAIWACTWPGLYAEEGSILRTLALALGGLLFGYALFPTLCLSLASAVYGITEFPEKAWIMVNARRKRLEAQHRTAEAARQDARDPALKRRIVLRPRRPSLSAAMDIAV
mmetsp:Transcript_78533/g.243995  ORF Transcript_78533/g.243995 Transcript_78533/m.243995 type:complete len:144 (+) Transcript_78533:3-434(+)